MCMIYTLKTSISLHIRLVETGGSDTKVSDSLYELPTALNTNTKALAAHSGCP